MASKKSPLFRKIPVVEQKPNSSVVKKKKLSVSHAQPKPNKEPNIPKSSSPILRSRNKEIVEKDEFNDSDSETYNNKCMGVPIVPPVENRTIVHTYSGNFNDWVEQIKEKLHITKIEEKDEDTTCGIMCIKPDCCEKFRSPKVFLFWISLAAFTQGLVVNGFVNSVIPTVELRYAMTSSESGLIASMYDIGSLIFLLPVSYIGGKGHKMRWVSIGMLIMGLGSFVFTIPHWFGGYYNPSTKQNTLCTGKTPIIPCSSEENKYGYLNQFKWAFWAGQFLHGVGATPIYTLAITYLDENVNAASSAFYVAVFYSMSLVGPAVGFILGGILLGFYVDITGVKPNISPKDITVWVGAWWIGFVISGVLSLITALPLAAFPPSLKKKEAYVYPEVNKSNAGNNNEEDDEEERVTLELENRISMKATLNLIHEAVICAKHIMSNVVFMSITISGGMEMMLQAGLSTFGPKYLVANFGISNAYAPILAGLCTIPSGGFSVFVSGLIMRVFNLGPKSTQKLCVVVASLVIPTSFLFFMGCNLPTLNGISSVYDGQKNMSLSNPTLEAPCNIDCKCSNDSILFSPVCGEDLESYVSPCFAGCRSFDKEKNKYFNCSCVTLNSENNLSASPFTCANNNCNIVYLFMVSFSVFIFLTCFIPAPCLHVTLRCTQHEERSFALGIQWIFLRVLGSIPAPLLFGYFIDWNCTKWNEHCGGKGPCSSYNHSGLQFVFFLITIIAKGVSLLCLILALIMMNKGSGNYDNSYFPEYTSPKPKDMSPNESPKAVTI